jgi:glycerol kinase
MVGGAMGGAMGGAILAIDQGTTSTRAIVFSAEGRPLAIARRDLTQHYPHAGWVEHDGEAIWQDAVAVAREALAIAGVPVLALGITNQRETTLLWDRRTGEPVAPAIVWQDRRTADACAKLRAGGAEPLVRARTGLLLDPYFSATKLAWLLDRPGIRARAERGELAFGTVDSFLLWRLTEGRVHATDAANASRTLLFDIHRQSWDDDLLALFGIPASLLPEVRDNSTIFGETTLLGGTIPIGGMAGDQQAALVGQACFTPGMVKSTYGTGCFALLNTGTQAVTSSRGMLTTVACRLGGEVQYALEGSIFVAGAAIKWLRDGIGLITHASQTDDMATRVADNHGVYMVPGFTGLGAPHWDPHARGLICGLTLDATAAHIARAALESVAYQTLDLLDAMAADAGRGADALRVDGGMAANDWFCQFLADMLQTPVERPAVLETTALGAAFLAGLAVGLYSEPADIAAQWQCERRFEPRMTEDMRAQLVAGWKIAVARSLT